MTGERAFEGPYDDFCRTLPASRRTIAAPLSAVLGSVLSPEQTQASWATQVLASRRFVETAPTLATFIDLPALGVRGNSHLPMCDLNSNRVAALIDRWIRRHSL
ncbi:MAG TPA: hypothetical protein VGX68_07190 [Thermoanaerobaculia bacterium]|jgi:hypothetical protein|nr:hypothetical protein [Thermoanaerobaculia bacterium]